MGKCLNRRLFVLLIIFILSVLLAVLKGSVNIPLSELLLLQNKPIIYLRLLRILAAIMAGSGLAVAE